MIQFELSSPLTILLLLVPVAVLLAGIIIGYIMGRNSADKPIVAPLMRPSKPGIVDNLESGYIQDNILDPNKLEGGIPTMRE